MGGVGTCGIVVFVRASSKYPLLIIKKKQRKKKKKNLPMFEKKIDPHGHFVSCLVADS